MFPCRLSPNSFGSDTPRVKKLNHNHDGLCYTALEEELKNDFDKDFILEGLKNGFDIIDASPTLVQVHCQNHPWAKPVSPPYDKASEQVMNEILVGNYEVVSEAPDIINPMGVISKPDGGVRLNHDCL